MDTSGYNKIDDYLLERLEGEELTAFELQLQTDMEFAKKVDQQRQAMNLLGKVGDLEMKREIQEAQAKFKAKNTPWIKILRPWIAAAAAVLVLVVSYFAFQKPTAQQLFKSNYVAYNASFGDRNGDDEVEIKLAEASKFYQQKNYEKALPVFESVRFEVKNAKFYLMLGITYIELDRFEKAQELFKLIIDEKDPVFQYHGLWYSAMAYLKAGDIKNTKIQLQGLVDASNANDVYKQDRAKKLLKNL